MSEAGLEVVDAERYEETGFEASRRRFLQGMGVVAAGAAVLPGFGFLAADAEIEWLGGY